MSDDAVQIIARGPRAIAEAAAVALDADPRLEAATYSILEEDEDRDVWRIDHGRAPGRCRLASHVPVRPAAGAGGSLLRLRRP